MSSTQRVAAIAWRISGSERAPASWFGTSIAVPDLARKIWTLGSSAYGATPSRSASIA